jgi:hypothetical protein
VAFVVCTVDKKVKHKFLGTGVALPVIYLERDTLKEVGEHEKTFA